MTTSRSRVPIEGGGEGRKAQRGAGADPVIEELWGYLASRGLEGTIESPGNVGRALIGRVNDPQETRRRQAPLALVGDDDRLARLRCTTR